MEDSTLLWLTTNKATTWWIQHVASRLDPLVFRATGGRYFSMGAPDMPMVTLSTRGRKTGKTRRVHLAAIPHEGDHLIVASAMGQERHPAWRYNLEAHPEIEVQMPGERYLARASVLDDAEKAAVWEKVKETIPQIGVYEGRTDRNIRVFRLQRV